MKQLNKLISLAPVRSLRLLWAAGIAALLFGSSCKKFLTIPLPVNTIAGSDAYVSDQSTSGVLDYIYSLLMSYNGGSFSNNAGVGYNSGLYTDELQNINVNSIQFRAFYSNVITGDQGGAWWVNLYKVIGIANTTIGAMQSSGLPNRNQWLGEALFDRALSYFYLVNLYGDVPLALTSDYLTNNQLSPHAESDGIQSDRSRSETGPGAAGRRLPGLQRENDHRQGPPQPCGGYCAAGPG